MSLTFAGNAFEKLLYNLAGDKYRILVKIALNWKKIVGPLLAQRTELTRFSNNILYVGVSNSVWLQELMLKRPQLLMDLKNNTGIDIKDIIFFIKT